MTADIVELATRRYGYRRIEALLHRAGCGGNVKRVERIWRQEGLNAPRRPPKQGSLWLNDGSCVRLRPEYPNHVWCYDFVEDRTRNGRKFRMLNVIDGFARECLALALLDRLQAAGRRGAAFRSLRLPATSLAVSRDRGSLEPRSIRCSIRCRFRPPAPGCSS